MPLRRSAVGADDDRVEESLGLCAKIRLNFPRAAGQLPLQEFLQRLAGMDVLGNADAGCDLSHRHERDVVDPIAHVGAERGQVQRFWNDRGGGRGSRLAHLNAPTTGRRSAGRSSLHSGTYAPISSSSTLSRSFWGTG